jgi:hypothetical protein
MPNDVPQRVPLVGPSRRTLRLSFRASGGEVRLESVERLDMICPPPIGFWMELRDQSERVLFHRLLHTPLGESVEVHSPDGKIQRVFGEVNESMFEVLLPDDPAGASVALMGETLDVKELLARRIQASRELARFEIPRTVGGGPHRPGGVR